jgi:hypothetical protein
MAVFLYIKAIIFALLSQLGFSTVITNVLTNASLVAIAAGLAIALPPTLLLAFIIIAVFILSQTH